MEITLEKWKAGDGQGFYTASNDDELYSNMSASFPKTLEECQQLVHQFASGLDRTEYVRAVKIDGQIAGCIAAFFESDMYCKNAELAYWLNRSYWGKGIMTQVITDFTDTLFSECGLHRIWARPFEQNQASRKVLEKSGFLYEGTLRDSVYKNGCYFNAVVYALIKQ